MKFGQSFFLAASTILGLATLSVPAQAALVTYNLTFTGSSSSGTGTATFDDSLLIPNQNFTLFNDLTGLQGFSANFIELPSSPSTTSFGLSDITGWALETDSNAEIIDLNFFAGGTLNADGYRVDGVGLFTLALFDSQGQTIDVYSTTVTPAAVATTPEPFSVVALFVAGSGMLLAKRKTSV